MEDLINTFHNLGGRTIAEHKRNFNAYLKQLKSTDLNADEFFKALTPKHRQEEIFHVILLREFNRHDELMGVLKSGDRILCRLTLKDTKFLRSFFAISGRDFVEEICPQVSFVTRTNLINKLSYLVKDCGIGEDYYGAVYAKYGLRSASPLLLACSEGFIRGVMKGFSLQFNDRQLIYLHGKYPALVESYLEANFVRDCSMKFSTYLALKDLATFRKLSATVRFSLGKRLYLRYLKAYKSVLLEDSTKFNLEIKKRLICRTLNLEEFTKFFTNSFPKQQRYYSLYTQIGYLKMLPVGIRGKVLFHAYKEVNGVEIWSKNDYQVDKDLLAVLSTEDRMKFDFIENFPELLPVEESLPILKSKINVTASFHERAELAQKLLETCKANDSDLDALLEVLQYFCKRHKNDNVQVRQNFMSYLTNNFALDTLGVDYWNLIEELLLLFEVNKEYLYCIADILAKFVLFKINNGLDYREQLLKFYKQQGIYHLNLSDRLPKHQKECLLLYPEMIPELFTEKKDVASASIMFLNEILDYSQKFPKNPICAYDYFDYWVLLLDQFEDNKYYSSGLIVRLLNCLPVTETQHEQYSGYLSRILKAHSRGFASEINIWILKNKPEIFCDGLESVLDADHSWGSTFCYEISKMEYLGLTNKLIQHALTTLQKPELEVHRVKTCLKFLSYQKSQDFTRSIQNYLPKPDCKIDVRESFVEKAVEIQTALIQYFKNAPVPSNNLSDVLLFCNADYFKYALEPLYFSMYHTPENQIEAPIFELLKRAVSVRKHTVHLTAALASMELKSKVFAQMARTERNVSVRKYIFGKIFKFFISEQSKSAWKLLSENLGLISENDVETRCAIKEFRKIPKKFYNRYLQLIWDYFKKSGKHEEFSLLGHFDVEDTEFYARVIVESLFHEKNTDIAATELFVAKYLLLDADSMDRRLDLVWGLVKAHLGSSGDTDKSFFSLLSAILRTALGRKPDNVAERLLVSKIKSRIGELNVTLHRLRYELEIDTAEFFTSWDFTTMDQLGGFVCAQLKSLIGKYGPEVTHLFADFVAESYVIPMIPMKGDHEESVYTLIHSFLSVDDSAHVGLLGVLLLPTTRCGDKALEGKVLEKLGGNASPLVGVYFEKYMMDRCED